MTTKKADEAVILEAEELAAKAQQLRVDACSAEVTEVLQRHKCTFKPFFIIDGSQIRPYVNIVPVSGNSPPIQQIMRSDSQ